MVTVTRTTPIRIRSGVALALKELSGVDSVSDTASFLLILAIFGNNGLHGKLSPEAQRELGADLFDIFGNFLQIFAAGVREGEVTLSDVLEKAQKARK